MSFVLNSGFLSSEKNQPMGDEINPLNLTNMQRACANLLSKGYTAKAIANHLNISVRTVETHICNIKEKLACRNKTELILKLIKGC